jgi:hypothetical protein
MLRVLLTIVLPLLLPLALYLLWVGALSSWHEGAGIAWHAVPWGWLAIAGVALLAAVLAVVTVGFGTPQQGVYVPPRWEGGRIIPGHMAPRDRP